MISDDMQLEDEQSGQEVDPIQGSERTPQRAGDPSMSNTGKSEDPSLTIQPAQAAHDREENTSSAMSKGDAPRGTVMDKPEETRSVSSGDVPGAPKPVKEAETPWFNHEELDELHSRWTTIQIQFVEDPCSAVEQGEAMVAETVERVKQMLSDRQQSVSQQWLNHDEITTEELRVTLLNYRSLLNSMLKL